MNWLALIPLASVLWLGVLAYGYSRMFNDAKPRPIRHQPPDDGCAACQHSRPDN